jgi:hypothetical protein
LKRKGINHKSIIKNKSKIKNSLSLKDLFKEERLAKDWKKKSLKSTE